MSEWLAETDLTLTILGRLMLAAAVGALIGLERAWRRKPAGVRTFLLISVGSALFTITSYEMASRYGGDHTRIAAQIVAGIGFLGAGAILRERGMVVGMTTAASIWVVAAVGMAIGAGLYVTGVFGGIATLLLMIVLGWIEDRTIKSRPMIFRLTTPNLEGVMGTANKTLAEMNVPMSHFQLHRVGADYLIEFDAEVNQSQQEHLVKKFGEVGAKCEVVPYDLRGE